MFATNIQEDILWKQSSETFKQNPRKIPTKKFIFSKVEGSKNDFIHAFFNVFAKSFSNFVHDFWKNCCQNSKQLLQIG